MKTWIKKEIVLVLSFILAFLSCLFVIPGKHLISAIDFKTLSLLFCLMLVMEGFREIGLFRLMADKLLQKARHVKALLLLLILLCFFSSMIITNDVALITFVPFTFIVLKYSGLEKYMIWITVLETVAANLGSMLLPIGNPQNLYLFSTYQMSFCDFVTAVLPYAFFSLILLCIFASFISKKQKVLIQAKHEIEITDKRAVLVYAAMFLLCLLTVFHVIPYVITLILCVILACLVDVKVMKCVDYSLLLTFLFLFVFIGNLGQISYVNFFLKEMLTGREVPVAILSSQIISNVPAAILLSGFTEDGTALLTGTNLGGLGTIIASMASLISFKFILKEKVSCGAYLVHFTWINLLFLLCNVILWICIN